jgi:hypothetical protein
MEYPEEYGNPMDDEEFLGGMVKLHMQCAFRGIHLRVTLNGEPLVIAQHPEMGNA